MSTLGYANPVKKVIEPSRVGYQGIDRSDRTRIDQFNNEPSAIFQVDSDDSGFLPPRMTTTQRDAIVAPTAGLVIYNTSTSALETYDGSAWKSGGGNGASASTTMVNIKTFGAVGDGVADDTAAVKAALESGKPVFVPNGNYRLVAGATNGNSAIMTTPRNIYMEGESKDGVRFFLDTSNMAAGDWAGDTGRAAFMIYSWDYAPIFDYNPTSGTFRPTWPAGTKTITIPTGAGAVASSAITQVKVGDLVQIIAPNATTADLIAGRGAGVYRVAAISGSDITLDTPIVWDTFDGTRDARVQVRRGYVVTMKNMTFDTVDYTQGNGVAMFNYLVDSLFQDIVCKGGGRQGIGVGASHNVLFNRVQASDFYLGQGYNDQNGAVTQATRPSGVVTGFGYGVYIYNGSYVTVRDSRFYNCRHACAVGGSNTSWSQFILYENCTSTFDHNGAYDAHPPTYSTRIVRCNAFNGYSGAWIRGKKTSFEGCEFSYGIDGIRVMEWGTDVTVLNCTFNKNQYGINVIESQDSSNLIFDRSNIHISDNKINGSTAAAIRFNGNAGSTYKNITVANNHLDGLGTGVISNHYLTCRFADVLITGNLMENGMNATGRSHYPFWFNVENVDAAADNVQILNNRFIYGAATGYSYLSMQGGTGTGGAGTGYRDVVVKNNIMRGTGSGSQPFEQAGTTWAPNTLFIYEEMIRNGTCESPLNTAQNTLTILSTDADQTLTIRTGMTVDLTSTLTANRNVFLPAQKLGQRYRISHKGNAFNWVVKNSDGSATIATLTPGMYVDIIHNLGAGGTGWRVTGYGAASLETGSATWDPASIAAGGTATTNITVTGAALGEFVTVAPPYSLQGLVCTAYVSAADTVTVVLYNPTTGAIDLASGTWKARVVQ